MAREALMARVCWDRVWGAQRGIWIFNGAKAPGVEMATPGDIV